MQWLPQSKRCTPCKNFGGALKIYILSLTSWTLSHPLSQPCCLLFSHHRTCGHRSSNRHVVLGSSYSKSNDAPWAWSLRNKSRSKEEKGTWSAVIEINEWSKAVENSSLIKLGCCRQDKSTICSSASYQAILPGSVATSETTDRLSLNADLLFFPSASCDARFRH